MSAAEVAERLHRAVDEVEEQRRQGLLLALPLGTARLGFPAWQFTPDGLLPGLAAVLRDLSVRDPWMQAAFFLSSDNRLGGRTPLDALRDGDIEAVRRAGAAYGEQLAS